MSSTLVSLDEIEQVVHAALIVYGATDHSARLIAQATRSAEAGGNVICGLAYVPTYCEALANGGIDDSRDPVITTPKEAMISADALNGFAHTAFDHGFAPALDMARRTGICALAIRHAHTCMALGYFTEQIARAGMIGLGYANSTSVVAPPGGTRPLLGTNPIAMSVPDGQGGIAFQFDFSTSVVALFKVKAAAELDRPIPEGWAVDIEGRPTTDPSDGLAGALIHAGDHKGWGLALMVEVLASALIGTASGWETQGPNVDSGPQLNLGQFYLLIDPQSFSDTDFFGGMANLAEQVAKQPGARLPGSMRQQADPVEIDQSTWDEVQRLASPR